MADIEAAVQNALKATRLVAEVAENFQEAAQSIREQARDAHEEFVEGMKREDANERKHAVSGDAAKAEQAGREAARMSTLIDGNDRWYLEEVYWMQNAAREFADGVAALAAEAQEKLRERMSSQRALAVDATSRVAKERNARSLGAGGARKSRKSPSPKRTRK